MARAAGSKGIVLVVDADELFGLMVEACLDFEGATVETAASLEQARGAVRTGLAGVVIEPALPDGDGLELLPLVAERCPGIPVVVCTDNPSLQADGAVILAKSDMARITEVLGLEPDHLHMPTDKLLHINALDLTFLDPE